MASLAFLATLVCSTFGAALDGRAARQADRPLLGSDLHGGIYSVQASGASFTTLFPCNLLNPVLTPDGRSYVAEAYGRRNGRPVPYLYRIPLDAALPKQCHVALSQLGDYYTGIEGRNAEFSPNGRRLLFIHPTNGRTTTAAANGSGRRVVGPRNVVAANWSPDGRKLVVAKQSFHADCPTKRGRPPSSNPYCWTGEILTVNANGSNARSLYIVPRDKPLREYIGIRSVDWSRSGQIVFTVQSGTRGSSHLAVINADGTGYRALTKWPYRGLNGVWSPDGSQIAYTRRGGGGVFLITPAGRPISNVTTTWAVNGLDW